MREILLYHGSKEEVVYPEIRITRYTKDFSWGFYCTNNYQQAYRWADRRSAYGIVNIYRYVENPELKILRFPEMSDEWLDFIAKCRAGETHPYDIVEGPMSDDTIWDYVNGFTSGQISREAFWASTTPTPKRKRQHCSPKYAPAMCASCWAARQKWAQEPMCSSVLWQCIIWMSAGNPVI